MCFYYSSLSSTLHSFTDAEQFLLSIGGLDDVDYDVKGDWGIKGISDHFTIGYSSGFSTR